MRHDVLVAGHIVAIFALASCSVNDPAKKDTSSLNSLETYTINDDSLKNRCETDSSEASDMLFDSVEYPPGKKDIYQKAMENSLRAIPAGVQEFFKNDLKGKILVTSDAKKTCKDDGDDGRLQVRQVEAEACYTIEDPMVKEPRLNVIILADEQAIAHNTVKVFGFLVAQLYSRYKPSLKFATAKMALSRTYLMDTVGSDIFTAKEVDELLGKGVYAKVSDNLKDDKADVLDGIRFDPRGKEDGTIKSDRRVFEEEIFAESFDSFYCNDKAEYEPDTKARLKELRSKDIKKRDALLLETQNTQKLMKDVFTGTWTIFRQIDEILQKADVKSVPKPKSDNDEEEKSDGLALTDEARKELCQQFPDADECDKEDTKKDPADDDREAPEPETPEDKRLKEELCKLFPWAEGCDDLDDGDQQDPRGDDPSSGDKLLSKLKPIIINIIINFSPNQRPKSLKGGRCGRRYRDYGARRW